GTRSSPFRCASSSGSPSVLQLSLSGRHPRPYRADMIETAFILPRANHEEDQDMKLRIGTAPISWGVLLPSDPKQTPWNRFLDEVAAAGYEGTELGPYGYLPTDSTRLKN